MVFLDSLEMSNLCIKDLGAIEALEALKVLDILEVVIVIENPKGSQLILACSFFFTTPLQT